MSKNLESRIVISIAQQELYYYQENDLQKTYWVATAKNGTGQLMGSECTPLGKHRVCEKIGDLAAPNSVFVARQFTGEMYSDDFAKDHPERDWILTRILWLEGLQEGLNKGDSMNNDIKNDSQQTDEPVSCDTRQRFIYIHGCPDSHPMQIPSSHGCIKMRNTDIIELYDLVTVGIPVDIQQ